MQLDVHIVNAFIDGETGGNPAGVVIDANGLNAAQKLEVARQVGLSETAFVSDSETATIKLEFFTPVRQIAHCGHATIATFSLLVQQQLIADGSHSKETIEGNRDIRVEGGMVFMQQLAPRYNRIAAGSDLANRVVASLGSSPMRFLDGVEPVVVNTGNSFLLVPLADEQSLAGMQPDQQLMHEVSEELDLVGYYAFSTMTKVKGRHAGTRMFAPRYGIPEEAATGMAAGPLACFLHDYLGVQAQEILIEQGWWMQPPSPSVLKVVLEVSAGRIAGLLAGGKAAVTSTLRVEV